VIVSGFRLTEARGPKHTPSLWGGVAARSLSFTSLSLPFFHLEQIKSPYAETVRQKLAEWGA